MMAPHPSAGPHNAPAGTHQAAIGGGPSAGAATPTPVPDANTDSATTHAPGGRGTMAYGFASSSERDNTGHTQRRGLSNSQSTEDAGVENGEEEEVSGEVEEEEEEEEDDDDEDETNGQAGMRRQVGSSPTPAQHAKTTTTTTTMAASSSSSSGGAVDFHRRNSGEATRAGFRMINSDSSAFGGLFVSRCGPRRLVVDEGVVVKLEDELDDSGAEVGVASAKERAKVDEGSVLVLCARIIIPYI